MTDSLVEAAPAEETPAETTESPISGDEPVVGTDGNELRGSEQSFDAGEVKQADEKELESFEDFKDEDGLVLGKYKDEATLIKAHQEAQKKITELGQLKAPEAPESYEFSFGEDSPLADVDLTPEDPALAAVLPVMKENNITQDQAQAIVEAYLGYEMSSLPNQEKELAELGGQQGEVLTTLSTEVASKLSDDEMRVFEGMTTTAAQAKLLHKIYSLNSSGGNLQKEVKTAPVGNAAEMKSKALAFRKENAREISMDPRMQDEYHRMMKAAVDAEKREGTNK